MKKYKVDFINSSYQRFYQQYKEEILKAIKKCLSRGDFILREETRKFEEEFAKFCGKKYCVSVRSGTAAINLAISVINKDYNWIKQSYCYKIPSLKNAKVIPISQSAMRLSVLKNELKKKDVVFITYINSVQPDMKRLRELKKKYKFVLIEDACQAVGRELIGDLSCFSFYPAKILGGMGKGGAIVSDNKKLIEKIRKQRDDLFNNLWLDEVKCAFLRVKLKYLKKQLKGRQRITNLYTEELSKIPQVKILSEKCLQNYIIFSKDCERLRDFLEKKGIETMPDKSDFYEGNLENAIRLPIYPEMANQEVKYVIKCINEFYK